jgi:hypothetical protein
MAKRAFTLLGVVALLSGVLTQSNTWFQLSKIGVPYPGPLVGFLDTPSWGAGLAFLAGWLCRRPWSAVVAGPAVILVSFIGYYASYGWSAGGSGAQSWVVVALLSGPVAGGFGWLSRDRRLRWLIGAPIGFLCADALAVAVDRSPHLDGSQFANVAFSMAVVAIVFAIASRGAIRERVILLLSTGGFTVVIFIALATVIEPLVEVLFSGSWNWPMFPDFNGDGRPN